MFPGGNISPQDGYLPPVNDVRRHEDSEAYRMGAIRECFEESGILLAKSKGKPQEMLDLSEEEREHGRHSIHRGEFTFSDWLERKGGVSDLNALHAFTRWLTPSNGPRRRFSTQMYLYFLPLTSSSDLPKAIHTPTSDGGIEHTAAEFLPASEWIARSRVGGIILFPPQFFLLSVIAPFLDSVPHAKDAAALQAQRNQLLAFIGRKEDGDPTWAEKCISPTPIWKDGKRVFMSLQPAGPELEETGRRGDSRRVVSGVFREGRPQDLEVHWKTDVIKEKEQRGKGGSHEFSREQLEKERAQSASRGKERL